MWDLSFLTRMELMSPALKVQSEPLHCQGSPVLYKFKEKLLATGSKEILGPSNSLDCHPPCSCHPSHSDLLKV